MNVDAVYHSHTDHLFIRLFLLPSGNLYVDGALFNNFPVNAFDGWFLKAGPSGSFHDQVVKLNPKLPENEASAVMVSRSVVKVLQAVMRSLIRRQLASGSLTPANLTIFLTLLSCLGWRRSSAAIPLTPLSLRHRAKNQVEIDLADTKLA